MFSPYWTPIVDLIAYHEAKAVLVPTDAARREGLATALARRTTPRTKVLYWNCPNNPTGDVFSRREVEEVAAFARERDLAVISDEAYEDLVYEGEPNVAIASLPGMYERTITAFTLSKSYSMTGWRLGYVDRARRATSRRSRPSSSTRPTASRRRRSGPRSRRSARHRVRRRVEKPATARGATGSSPACKAAGFELETPRAALYLFPKLPSWLGADSRAGRADAARRGEDRDRARHRLRPRGRGPPALLVLGVRGDDRRRRRGARARSPARAPRRR